MIAITEGSFTSSWSHSRLSYCSSLCSPTQTESASGRSFTRLIMKEAKSSTRILLPFTITKVRYQPRCLNCTRCTRHKTHLCEGINEQQSYFPPGSSRRETPNQFHLKQDKRRIGL